MCWSCDLANSIARTDAGALAHYRPAQGGAFSPSQSISTDALGGMLLGDWFGASTYSKYYDAFPADGVGDADKVFTAQTPLDLVAAAAIVDNVPGDTSSTATLTIGGPRIFSTINTPGDWDFYQVTLQAGVTYEFGMYSTTNGPSGVPLVDAFVEIYDSAGNLITFSDGGASTQLNSVNPGFDVLVDFTPDATGTYYINARAFDNAPEDGDTGDSVGDYELFGRLSLYHPYYDLDSPLHSLDWGTQFDGTSRNPDGAEGPRPTGNELENKLDGKNVIYVYFAREGEVFVDNSANPLNLTTTIVANGLEAWERQAFETVFAEYEKAADIDYVETEDRWAADIVVVTYEGTPGPGVSLLGRMSPPDTPSEGQTEYNAGDERWTQEGLAPGGFYFGTLIHEFGHGHGMAHPHDNGGRSSVMRDGDTESGFVEETTPFNYTLGDFDLNQGVYTMMSYMDGWQLSPYGQADSDAGYGFIGSLMAFDIAVIQDKYGVNEEWATGNDTYVLIDENRTATFNPDGTIAQQATNYRSIWDAGGTDAIVYSGARNANIDLRAASLQYAEGGGGWISYAFGIFGGFTIANSVTIENAISGSGNDTLRGNDVANTLNGGAGIDVMIGGNGDDIYKVDNGADSVVEFAGGGSDSVYSTVSFALANGLSIEALLAEDAASTALIDLAGNEIGQVLAGNEGSNWLNGRGGADTLVGRGGNDSYIVGDSAAQVFEAVGGGNDIVYTSVSWSIRGGNEVETLLAEDAASTAAIDLSGNELAQVIAGNAGANRLDGGAGADSLVGRGGGDSFAFTTALGGGNVDTIFDFESADQILIDNAVFTGLAAGALAAGAFRLGTTAQDADDRILYDAATGALYFDADGSGGAAAVQFAAVTPGLGITASEFTVI